MTQSALSKHVLALEKECGASLFTRTSSRMRLTRAGQLLFEEAIVLVETHDKALEKIRFFQKNSTLLIGGLYNNPIVLVLIHKTLTDLSNEDNSVVISYQDYRHRPVLELVREGNIDIGITILCKGEDIGPDLSDVFLFNDPMIALAKEGHPYAKRDFLYMSDLDGQTILRPVGSYSTAHGESTVAYLCGRYDIRPIMQPVFVRSISELATVHNEDCLLIMEQSMLKTQPFTEDYTIIPFEDDDVQFAFYAIYRTDNDNPELDRFVDSLKLHA
jgi:DNA-binding transcriptional LysR family regulator